MKYLFIFFGLGIFFVNTLFAQLSFVQIVKRPEDQVINHITEDSEGNLILIGRIHHIDTYFAGGYILKVDSLGEIIQEKVLQQSDTSSCMLYNIHYWGDAFYTLGSQTIAYPNTTKLWYLELNSQLIIESEKLLNIPSNKWFSYMKSIIDSDTNTVITGYTTREDTSGPSPAPYNNDPFFYKLSLDGDSITSTFLSLPFKLTLSTDIIEKKKTPGYFAFGNDFTDLSSKGQRYELSKNFDSLNVVGVPAELDGYITSAWLNDTSILICGEGGSEYCLSVLTHTAGNIPIDYNCFKMEGDNRDHPALYYGVGKNEDNTYIGGTSNADYSNPYFSSFDSWFHLIKVNPDLTPIWEYWYGGDTYYFLYCILATSDGGCVMVGTRYDDEVQNLERDIYIVKVDSNGIITSTPEYPSAEICEAIVYPNPGTDYLKVRIAIQYDHSFFQLFDINGSIVISKQINGQMEEVNTSRLIAGTYIYGIFNDEGLYESGKWIKQ